MLVAFLLLEQLFFQELRAKSQATPPMNPLIPEARLTCDDACSCSPADPGSLHDLATAGT